MRIFISGGCKNGKSFFAQDFAKKLQKTDLPLYYLATMLPVDAEDERRIENHRRDRNGWGFETIEAADSILSATKNCDFRGAFLLDSVTALLANEMFPRRGEMDHGAALRVARNLVTLAEKASDIVFVSDFIYSDAQIYDDLTEAYRRGLAFIDRELAKVCDSVLEIVHGTATEYKPAAFDSKVDDV